jgi:molybdenum cofactor sulfurtransferase
MAMVSLYARYTIIQSWTLAMDKSKVLSLLSTSAIAEAWVSNTEVEKLATIKNIHLRTGGLCNPGGVASALGLAPWEMKRNFSAGQRCGNDNDVLEGKPTGVIRVSLGAMSNMRDITAFLDFVREFFVEKHPNPADSVPFQSQYGEMFVQSLTVYPIKSCGGWKIPPGPVGC